jgi:hypothetical protein
MKESSIGLRQAYTVIKNAYKAKQRNPVTTASDLRSLVPVVTGKTQYTFPIIVGEDVNNFPEGILLNRADAFTAIEMGIFIGKKSSNSDTTYDLYSYPNLVEFSANSGADADKFKTLFNHSTINATINNVQYLQNFSTNRFRTTGTTQNGSGYGATTPALSPAGPITLTSTVVDEFNSGYGYTAIVPTLQLSGTSKIDITVSLPEGLTAAGSGSYVIILALRGFLSLGASNLNK